MYLGAKRCVYWIPEPRDYRSGIQDEEIMSLDTRTKKLRNEGIGYRYGSRYRVLVTGTKDLWVWIQESKMVLDTGTKRI